MPFNPIKYQRMSSEGNDHDSDRYYYERTTRGQPVLLDCKFAVSVACLVFSLVVNVLLVISRMRSSDWHPTNPENMDTLSTYAKLDRNLPIAIERSSAYGSHNLTEVRRLWEAISIDDGMVALPDSFVAQHGLPKAQRFPWDDRKGLYFLNGYHNLHCLRSVHISLIEFANGEKQSRHFGHVLHCMNSLREDILCNADDTPRFTTKSKVPESGVGQIRYCRNWASLERWARQYNACYRFINQTASGFPNVQRYAFCPEGSPYKEEVDRIFGRVKE